MVALLGVFLFFFPSDAYALLDKDKYSEAEKAGFAFYRLSNMAPDFYDWVKYSDSYLKAQPEDQDKILQKDSYRLEQGFRDYFPDEDLSVIKAKVMIKFPNALEREDLVKKRQKIPVNIVFTDIKESHFPFQAGDIWVTLIPNEIENALSLQFTSKEFVLFAKRLRMKAEAIQLNAELVLRLRPVSAGKEAPFIVDNIELWMVLTEIGSIEIWSPNHDSFIWSYEEDWFVSDEYKLLQDLFNK